MRMFSRVSLAAGGALLVTLAAVPLVHAETGDPATNPLSSDSTQTQQADDAAGKAAAAKAEAAKKAAEAKAKAEAARLKAEDAKQHAASGGKGQGGKLNGNQLKNCQRHEATIDGLLTRIGSRGQKQLELVDTISTRLQKLVTDKNLTVPNYATLLADVNAKRAAAQAAVEDVKSTQTAFKCDGSDPKGAASQFQGKMKTMNDAIKAYRDAVKALLKAIMQVMGVSTGDGPGSPSPTPPTPLPPGTPTPTPSSGGTDDGGTDADSHKPVPPPAPAP